MRFTDGPQRFSVDDNCQVNDILKALFAQHPMLQPYLLTAEGNLNNYIRIFINQRELSDYQTDAIIENNSQVDIISAIVGG